MSNNDMKHVSTRKLVTLEEHVSTVSMRELLELIIADDPTNVVRERDMKLQVVMPSNEEEGKNVVFPASTILELIRTTNQNVPEDAEVVIGVRWRQETEIQPGQQIAPTGQVIPPMPVMQPGVPMVAQVAQVTQALGADPSLPPAICATCGSIPVVHGPTPECNDEQGCGPVRARYGNLPIPQSVPSQAGVPVVNNQGPPPQQPSPWQTGMQQPMMQPQMMQQPAPVPQGLRIPKGRAFNPQTGEVAFLSKDGQPYGKGEYIDDRISRRNI